MFDRLVITDSEPMPNGLKWYLLFATFAVLMALAAGLVISLFSKELSLGTDNFELVQLVAPVEQPVPEPEPPEPEEQPELRQPVIKERTAPIEAPPPRRETRARTTRRVNMARLDETPPAVPKRISNERNAYRSRPVDRYFQIGKFDIDHGARHSPGKTGNGGSSSGSGSASGFSAGESLADLTKTTPPPPPPRRKKAPAVKKAKRPVTRSLGVINGKATSLPKPKYPSAARAVRAQGKVNVRVLINESGRVVSADAVSGHPLLRNAAEAAARNARFSPTLLSGAPVKVSGVIVYNFVV